MFFENGNSRLVRWLIFAAGFTALPFAAAALDYTQIDYPGADATVPLGINNRGDIVGLYRLGTSGHIFLLSSAGTFSNIDPPGAASVAWVGGPNSRGDIVGTYIKGGHELGFLRTTSGAYSDITVPGAADAAVLNTNDSGDILGLVAIGSNPAQPFVIPNGNLKSIVFYPSNLQLTGINAKGDLVGSDDVHGVFVSKGMATDFDAPGASTTVAFGMNSRGDIVGGADTGGFLLRGGTFTLIAYPGADPASTVPTAINDAGVIVGEFRPPNSQAIHGFIAR